jgi:prepilin-type N-terminal cleavage/methylation domain-containing protein
MENRQNTPPPPTTRRSAPRGMTLLELMLVLALICIVVAVAMPTLRGTLSNQRLRKSADLVRAAFSRARVEAMRSGQIQAFHYQIEGNKYLTVPWYVAEVAVADGETDVAEVLSPVAPAGVISLDNADSLPEDVRFTIQAEGFLEQPEPMQLEEAVSELPDDGTGTAWSPPILFYPDGTASDARVVLANRRGWLATVQLRGLTGISLVDPLERVEEER